jgi:hypothetical protein
VTAAFIRGASHFFVEDYFVIALRALELKRGGEIDGNQAHPPSARVGRMLFRRSSCLGPGSLNGDAVSIGRVEFCAKVSLFAVYR